MFATHISICSWTASFEYCGWCIRMQADILSTFGRCFWYRILWMASKSQDCHVAVVSSLVIFILLSLIYTFKYHFLPIHWLVARSFSRLTISFIWPPCSSSYLFHSFTSNDITHFHVKYHHYNKYTSVLNITCIIDATHPYRSTVFKFGTLFLEVYFPWSGIAFFEINLTFFPRLYLFLVLWITQLCYILFQGFVANPRKRGHRDSLHGWYTVSCLQFSSLKFE